MRGMVSVRLSIVLPVILSLATLLSATRVGPALAAEPKHDATAPQQQTASAPSTARFRSNELLIRLTPAAKQHVTAHPAPGDTGLASLDALTRRSGALSFRQVITPGKTSLPSHPLLNWYLIQLATGSARGLLSWSDPAAGSMRQLLAQYRADPNVSAAEPNYLVQADVIPNDPYYSSSGSWGQSFADMWGMHKINAEAAWDQTTGSSSVVVADVDTGLDRTHPDIKDNMWVNAKEIPNNGIDDDNNGYVDDYYGWNWCGGNNDPTDDNGHGTHTAGTIAGEGNNGTGVVGVSWHTPVMALKFLCSDGSGSIANGAKALQYAADMGAKISSNSWGCSCQSSILDDAVRYEHDKGMVVVAAAGNSSSNALDFSPAAADDAIAVSATDSNDQLASFSNSGPKIDVAAPGVDILSLNAANTTLCSSRGDVVGTSYCHLSGTSMATPHVAGLAALIWSKNPTLSNDEVRQVIRTGADDLGPVGKDDSFGYGRIDVTSSVNLAGSHVLAPRITSPVSRSDLTGSSVDLMGTIPGPNFASYTLQEGAGREPSSWTTLAQSTTQVINGKLGTLNTGALPDGTYSVRLTATDTSGHTYQYQVFDLAVDNFTAALSSPTNSVYTQPVPITGTAQTNNGVVFSSYTLDYGVGSSPTSWSTTGITLATGGTLPVTNGTLGTWDPSSLINNQTYTLRLTVYSSDSRSKQTEVTVTEDKEVLPGWPKTAGSGSFSDVVIGDLNGDGKKEIVAAVGGQSLLYAYNKDGSSLAGWPVTLSFPPTALAIADMNGDGKQDVIAMNGSNITVVNHDGTQLPGWPQTVPYGMGSPSVGDLAGTGSNQIVVVSSNSAAGSVSVYALNGDGTIVSGFPKTVFSGASMMSTSFDTYYVNLVDLDGTGKLSMILAPRLYNIDKVYVLDYQGNIRPGWPQSVGAGREVYQTLAGDILGTGKKQIVVYYSSCQNCSGFATYLDVFDSSGVPIPNYPQAAGNGIDTMGPALADVDGDGVLDIVMPTYGDGTSRFAGSPLVFTKNGLIPFQYSSELHQVPATMVSFTGSGTPDAVLGSEAGDLGVYAPFYNASGQLGWNIIWSKRPGCCISPLVADLGNTGKWDVVGVLGNQVLAWEPNISGNVAKGSPWTDSQKDAARSDTVPVTSQSDTVPPSVAITSPANGVYVAGQVPVSATASDNVGVTKVEFSVDGTLMATGTTAPYGFTWNSTSAPNGSSHTISAKAYDAAGNTSTSSISVIVKDTTPPTAPTNLAATVVSSTQINLAWTASTDNVGVTAYDIYRNNTKIASVATTSYADTGLAKNTKYTYYVQARDAAGNVSAASNTAAATTPKR